MSRLISVRRTLQLLKSIYPILRPPPPPPFGPARALCSSAPTSTSSRVRAPQVPRLHGPRRLLRRRHLLLLPLLRHRQAQEGLALPLRTLARRGTSQRLQQEHHPRGPHPPLPPARVSLPARVRRPGCPQKCREDPPCWVGLSPNGIGLSRAGMVNLALMDKVLEVEKEKKRVRVEAGIRVQELVDGIKEFGLTLQKFASIREQQMGGIVQVGALATGTLLPPIDEQIIAMKSVTPAKGTIEVSKVKDPELFYLARKLLSENKHIKYLYIPYTDTVVVVTCNPISKWKGPPIRLSDLTAVANSGSQKLVTMKDLEYIENLKQLIEKENIPAPASIEQLWTARSKIPMSPASSPSEDDIISWVGIIMYLPTNDPRQRKDITVELFHYRHLTQEKLWDRYSAYEHWAKDLRSSRIRMRSPLCTKAKKTLLHR